MTNKEALRFFTYSSKNYETVAEGLISDADYEYERQWNLQQMDLCDTAIKALEKQIPKKPEIINAEFLMERCVMHYCPICNRYLDQVEQDTFMFCPECGQAIDWSEDD